MPSLRLHSILLVALLAVCATAGFGDKPNWPFGQIPHTTETGQVGYNDCGTGSSQDADCQTLHFNSLDDFCLWAPQSGQTDVASVEQSVVAWCTTQGHGSRIIPAGTISGAHFVKTSTYIQITGHLNGPNINIVKGNPGGELDPHGATGNGNPIGGLLYTTAFGNGVQQIKEWMAYMGDGEFCMRACNPADPNAWMQCQHIYDTMGCDWVMPGDYSASFDTCQGDPVAPPGVYGASTFHQGDPKTPVAHPAGATSNCQKAATIVPALAVASAAANMSAVSNTTVSSALNVSASATSHSSVLSVSSSSSSSSRIIAPSTTPALLSSTPSAAAAAPSSSGAGAVYGPIGIVLGFVGLAVGLLA